MNNIDQIIRGTVNGQAKYCRAPIKRRRYPITAEEFLEYLKKYSNERGEVCTDKIVADIEINDSQCDYQSAGRLICVLDFLRIFCRYTAAEVEK